MTIMALVHEPQSSAHHDGCVVSLVGSSIACIAHSSWASHWLTSSDTLMTNPTFGVMNLFD